MDSLWAILQLTVIALLGAAYVALALWDMRQPDDPYKGWKSHEDVVHKPTRTELGRLR